MSDTDEKELIELRINLIRYMRSIIKFSSTINNEEIKQYFIFWLYLTHLTDKRIQIDDKLTIDDVIINELNKRIQKHNNNKKITKKILIDNQPIKITYKSLYFALKFYLDCGLYHIKYESFKEFLDMLLVWYDEFLTNMNEFKKCMKIDIVPPSAHGMFNNT